MDDLMEYDYTDAAWEALYDAVDDSKFAEQDAQLIYNSLMHHIRLRSFGDYLKRYIYLKAGLTEPFSEVPIKEYQLIIRSAFSDNQTPASFSPTSAKLSALSKNWLTQQTVSRNVVFLLGFGLNMSVEDVNLFLTKALQEQEINSKNPFEVICWYCFQRHYTFPKFEQLWEHYQTALPKAPEPGHIRLDRTIGYRHSMQAIHDDASLLSHLAQLKANESISLMSLTARSCFDALYSESQELTAKIYNTLSEEEYEAAVQEYMNKLSNSDRLSDWEKQARILAFRSKKKGFRREDITESHIEHVICAAIPTDRHGNLTPGKASRLNQQFAGKRFSRQRISEIL